MEWEVILVYEMFWWLALWICWRQSHNERITWIGDIYIVDHDGGYSGITCESRDGNMVKRYGHSSWFSIREKNQSPMGHQHTEKDTHHLKMWVMTCQIIGCMSLDVSWWHQWYEVENDDVRENTHAFCRKMLDMVGNADHIATTSPLKMSGSRNPEQK